MSDNNNNDYQKEKREYNYDEIFAQHKQELQKKHDERMEKEVQVKAKSQEEIDKDEQEKKDQQTITKELEKIYCICKHHKRHHDLEGYGSCHKKSAKLKNGKLVTVECQCNQFEAMTNRAQTVPTNF